jgi:hypothetical protein
MKTILLILTCSILIGCKTTQDEKITPPSVSTGILKESLITTKDDLMEAGELNNNISMQLDKAMTLAEQIDVLLEKIEKEQEKLRQKTIIPLELE